MILFSFLAILIAQAQITSFQLTDIVAVEKYNVDFDLLRLRNGTTRLVPSSVALQKIIKLNLQHEQAKDELETAQKVIATKDKDLELRKQIADSYKERLEDEKKRWDQLYALIDAQRKEHAATLADLKTRMDAEAEAKDDVIKRLKGNRFFNAIKTGAKIGVGIGVGIAIGKIL